MNLPNSLSLFRIILAAVFTLCMTLYHASHANNLGLIQIALFCFITAALTDWLDGFLARKLNLVTSLGKLLDPLADKILVAAAFVGFTELGICPAWITIAILFREFSVTGLRLLLVEKGTVLPADNLGKWKTTTQMVYCVCILLGYSYQTFEPLLVGAPYILYLALGLTLASGANYLIKGGKALK